MRSICWWEEIPEKIFEGKYKEYFNNRSGYVMTLHGDLNLKNMGRKSNEEDPYTFDHHEKEEYLYKFDHSERKEYNTLDPIADFSMLLVDIEAHMVEKFLQVTPEDVAKDELLSEMLFCLDKRFRLNFEKASYEVKKKHISMGLNKTVEMFITSMKNNYLTYSHQAQTLSAIETTNAIFDYYLADRAMIRAVNSIVYNNEPELGEIFLVIGGNNLQKIRANQEYIK